MTQWGGPVEVEKVVQKAEGPPPPCTIEGHDFDQLMVESNAKDMVVPLMWVSDSDPKDNDGNYLITWTRLYCTKCGLTTSVIACDRSTHQ
jgi:cytochrome oxidase assembly protein ShyY1